MQDDQVHKIIKKDNKKSLLLVSFYLLILVIGAIATSI